jgi:uncharacterized membrane protein YeaQ/YmgE (transglycosylase-associated protein family)
LRGRPGKPILARCLPASVRDASVATIQGATIMGEAIRICLVGLVVGVIARFLFPGAVPMGLIGSILLGLGGSMVGGIVPRLVSPGQAGKTYAPAGFVGSVLGAMLIILLGRILF